ncbi:MAG: nucleotidyltransferase substrate binding protein [Clostridia bacterium]|nr:nucleotidyltransferase substrate binding protein [Clostridia bacterium]
MENLDNKYENYSNALLRLKEALEIVEPDEVQIDGIIQRFEFTFELAWKVLKEYLEYIGINDDVYGPRGVLKAAFAEGLIYDGDTWMKILEATNNMSHRYSYDESRKIYLDIKNTYVTLLENLCDKLKRGE